MHNPEAEWEVTFLDKLDYTVLKRVVHAPNPELAKHFAFMALLHEGISSSRISHIDTVRKN